MTRRATLDDVAARAAVSRQTVSNVINSPEKVRPATRQRVQSAIAELDYRPNIAARQLVTRRSHVLGFAVPPAGPGTRYPTSAVFLQALTEAAQTRGYRIMLFSAADDAAEIGQYRELLHSADLDGFILANTHHGDPRTQWLVERDVPFATFGRPWGAPSAAHHWVDVDGAAGTHAAVTHLAQSGHRRIGFVGWPAGSGVGDDRRAGWAAAMTELGTTDGQLQTWQTHSEDVVEAALAPIEQLLSAADPSALVCVSDTVAVAALRVAHRLGREIAVVGFDDAPVASAIELTSVRQPIAEAAARCLDLVLAQTSAADHLVLAPQLIVRSSTAGVAVPHTTRR